MANVKWYSIIHDDAKRLEVVMDGTQLVLVEFGMTCTRDHVSTPLNNAKHTARELRKLSEEQAEAIKKMLENGIEEVQKKWHKAFPDKINGSNIVPSMANKPYAYHPDYHSVVSSTRYVTQHEAHYYHAYYHELKLLNKSILSYLKASDRLKEIMDGININGVSRETIKEMAKIALTVEVAQTRNKMIEEMQEKQKREREELEKKHLREAQGLEIELEML